MVSNEKGIDWAHMKLRDGFAHAVMGKAYGYMASAVPLAASFAAKEWMQVLKSIVASLADAIDALLIFLHGGYE